MITYFEKLTTIHLLLILFRYPASLSSIDKKNIFFFDISKLAKKIIPILNNKTSFKFKELEFHMSKLRDENGELLRLRIYRDDLSEISKDIEESEEFRNYISQNNLPIRCRNYILRGIIDGEIYESSSINRSLYIIQVVRWHLNYSKEESGNLIVLDRAWINKLKKFATREKINISTLDFSLYYFWKSIKDMFKVSLFPKLYFIGKNIKYFKFDQPKFVSKRSTIFVEGRGDIYFKNDGNNSDFFWEINSNFDRKRIIYNYKTSLQKDELLDYGIFPISGSGKMSNIFSNSGITPIIGPTPENNYEYSEIKNLEKIYRSNFIYWRSIFEKYNSKVYFSWYKFDKSHIAAGEAISSLGGISALWQIALNAIQETMCRTDADILFSYSDHCASIDKKIGSRFKFNIISGHPKDYSIKASEEKSLQIRSYLESNGAENIVCVLDENSLDDPRWHTGHELQRENYIYMLENLLERQNFGVIFKPKRMIDLRKRLGDDISSLLDKAIETGRCYLFDETKGHTTLATPVAASLASDVCIHGHLCAGSAALESAIAGIPTILINREDSKASILAQLPKNSVVFANWNDATDSINGYFSSAKKNPEFGDWSSIINDLDPFRDGLGAQRIGNFLESLFQGFDEGLRKEDVMARAVEIYANKWGSDKIIK